MFMEKIMIGSYGIGKKIVTFALDARQYDKFKKYCTANNYEFQMPLENKNDKIVISCEESVFSKFRLKFFYLFLKPFTY